MSTQREWLMSKKKLRLWGTGLVIAAPFQWFPFVPLPIPAGILGPWGNAFLAAAFLVTGLVFLAIGLSEPNERMILNAFQTHGRISANVLVQAFEVRHKRAEQILIEMINGGSVDIGLIGKETNQYVTVRVLESKLRISTDAAEDLLVQCFFDNKVNIANQVTNDDPVSSWVCMFVGAGGHELKSPEIERKPGVDLSTFTAGNANIDVSTINQSLLGGDLRSDNWLV